MEFAKQFTTTDLKTASPETEKNKIILSNDAYAVGKMIDGLVERLDRIIGRLN